MPSLVFARRRRPAAGTMESVSLLALLVALLGVVSAVEVDVEAFGCTANGRTCTRAFNAAVTNVSAAGGGVVHVGRLHPGAYTVAGVEMKSHVTLVVHAGATINASRVLADWGPRRMVLPDCATGATGEPPELEHGVLGGLFHKARTGEGTLVDACLLRSGIFSMAAQVAMGGRVVQTSLRTFHS